MADMEEMRDMNKIIKETNKKKVMVMMVKIMKEINNV